MRLATFLLTILAVTTVRAQNDDDEDMPSPGLPVGPKDFGSNKAYLDSPIPKIEIQSIEPQRGPMTGETRVLVRGGPFSKWVTTYPHPMDYFCIQCESSPKSEFEGPMSFKVSVTGDFSDSMNHAEFTYYQPVQIERIQPRYGPKDGGTVVQVWGNNFKEFDLPTLCSFGTKTVIAEIKNATYLECRTPQSEVVQKAIPFSISQNDQQFSMDTKYFYYYNFPTVKQLVPPRGPESGDTLITLEGSNFFPFHEILNEVDNAEDVYCGFIDLKVRVLATVLSSTKATCKSPPSYYWHQSRVELTLNAADYTEDENIFYYYKPPILYDVDPREGPVAGGTEVYISGTGFENGQDIKCKFATIIVNATFVNPQQVLCVAPQFDKPGYVTLSISVHPELWSAPVKYLYYKTPTVEVFEPLQGPDFGFTQIEVHGQNFIDLGSNKAMCVFNKSIFTNATVFSETLLFCDSPPFRNKQGYSLLGSNNGENGDFYFIQITLDGGKVMTEATNKFYYYKQPQVLAVAPFGGPITGGTTVTLNVTGLTQANIGSIQVRFSSMELTPIVLNANQVTITAPAVDFLGTVVVQIAYNAQQFSDERVIHQKDKQASYEYYVDPLLTYHNPQQGPSTGGTQVSIYGQGLATFKQKATNSQPLNRLWVRFVDPSSKAVMFQQELDSKQFRNDLATFITPAQPSNTLALLQISRNGQNWLDVKDPSPAKSFSFEYYPAPHVTQLVPSFGPVKPTEDTNVTIKGSDFVCSNNNCKNVKVRFTDRDGNQILTPCEVISSQIIHAKIPKYTKPDVLFVEVSMNGLDFTSDNKTYGYYDPYLIDAQPRLISVNGTTIVTVTGLGFVDSGDVKTLFQNKNQPFTCHNSLCTQTATFVNSNSILSPTVPQSQMLYANGQSVMWDPFTIQASVYSDQFTDTFFTLHYYHDPHFNLLSSPETPANIPTELLVSVTIDPNDLELVSKYGHPKCRFSSGDHVLYTDGIFVGLPRSANDTNSAFNSIRCVTPHWVYQATTLKLDLSINGFDYSGNIDFTFTDQLLIHRVVPMAGPLSVSTSSVRLLGSGFSPSDSSLAYSNKWGVLQTSYFERAGVHSYQYYFQQWLKIDDNEELKCYNFEANSFDRRDSVMNEGQTYNIYNQPDPTLSVSTTTEGGPFFIEVGRDIQIELPNQSGRRLSSSNYFTYYEYMPSAVEFFHYKQCSLLQIHPTRGLTRGGTPVAVAGLDFRYWPEWGVVPHCKFGDKIVRGYFDSSVRLVCESPPNDIIDVKLPFEVSLNGFDWTTTGFTFNYYLEPVISSFTPDAGQATGGTFIYFKGQNFPKINDVKEMNCRFKPQSGKMNAKIMPVEWLNDTTLRVVAPGGWSEGDRMDLQLTFNGEDYDQNHFAFTFYNIAAVKPRSGPADGSGGDIIITGQGFRPDSQPLCKLNNTVYKPRSFTWTEIRCPMPPAEEGPDFFGNVEFAVSANNGADWHVFSGGFQYYKQPQVFDIEPKTGPAHGIGVINFFGTEFRADYALADLECKVGNNIGVAVFVKEGHMRCVVQDMDQVAEGERLSAQLALNGYSWTQTNDNEQGSTFFVPYSVNAIFPNSGSILGETEVLVVGSGFIENQDFQPRCRFGTPSNYAIVQAQVLSYTRLVCVTPPFTTMKANEKLPLEIPFAVALNQDQFDPWTATHHRFRYYKTPVIDSIYPTEVAVGLITEVLVMTDKSNENIFFEPFPAEAGSFDMENKDEAVSALLLSNQIKCKFGRFGETLAVFVNETCIKCVTPSVLDDPEDLSRETVKFSIAMNGYDYDLETNAFDFDFVGTGNDFGMGLTILGILLLGVLLVALIVFIQKHTQMSALSQDHGPNVAGFGENVEPRFRVVNSRGASRGVSRGGGPSRAQS